MRKKLILIALALVMANLIIFDGVAQHDLMLHRPVHCTYALESEMRVCQ